MKKLIAILLCMLLALSLAACGSSDKNDTALGNTTAVSSAQTAETRDSSDTRNLTTAAGSKVLVIYFSRTGEQYMLLFSLFWLLSQYTEYTHSSK